MKRNRVRARQLRNTPTDAERLLWRHLRLKQLGGCKFRRQVPLAGYIVDFLCPQQGLIVELDGGQHLDQVIYDRRRTLALESLGYRVLRYWNDDVLLRTVEVLEDILRGLEAGAGSARGELCPLGIKRKSKINSTPRQSSPALRAREEANTNTNCDSSGGTGTTTKEQG